MRRRNLMYYITEGIRGVFLHGFASIAAIGVIVACLLIMGSFSLLAVNIDHMITELEAGTEIVAYVDEELSVSEARSISSRINALDNVSDCVFVTREDALEQFKERFGDSGYLLDGIPPDWFPHRYEISITDVKDMRDTVNSVRGIRGISSVSALTELIDTFKSLRAVVSAVSYTLIVLLLCVSIFMISNTVKLATFDRKDEIAIMRVVGATNSFIRWPFVVEGFLLGSIGALAAFFAQWAVYNNLAARIGTDPLFSGLITTLPFSEMFLPLLSAFVLVGFMAGVGGSVLTIRRFLRV